MTEELTWEETSRDVEEFLSAYTDVKVRVQRDPQRATFRFSPPLVPEIDVDVSVGDDWANLHVETTAESDYSRLLTRNSHPFGAPCPPYELRVAGLFLALHKVLSHEVQLREKRVVLFRRFLLFRRVFFEFYDHDAWQLVERG